MLFTGTDKCRRFNKPENNIYFTQCTLSNIYHIFTKFVLGFMDTRCIDKNNLSFFTRVYSLNTISCCLRFVGRNSNLLSDQMIH